ncbi:MAG TPA: hypothetical protein VMW83_14190 [Spirochaetia bacterium]|nr:hypothetical protein [Spirochaetia bacterium]
MANRYISKWAIGLFSVGMFTYFLGLSQHLDNNNLAAPGPRLVQNNTQNSVSNDIRNEWNAPENQGGTDNTATKGSTLITNGQVQQNSNHIYNSETQSSSSFVARSRAS